MGVPNDWIEQFRKLVRPLGIRIANMVARGVVQIADDSKKLALLQLGVLAGETVDAGEFHQAYGFSSVPLAGAEAVVLFPNGDRSHPLVVALSDRRNRPTGMQPGEACVYNDKGAKVKLLTNGDIEVQPGAGGKVYIRSDGGASDKLVTKTDFDTHTHPAPGGATSAPTVAAVGTAKLEAE